MRTLQLALVSVLVVKVFAETPSITGVTAQQRYPWNGKVDISYMVTGDIAAEAKQKALLTSLKVTATDRTANTTYTATQLSGDAALTAGTHSIVWDMEAEGLTFKSTNVVFKVSCETTPALYCVIDLSAGANATSYPVTYMSAPPSGGFNVDAYKTTKLVLRRIEPGSFLMCGEYNVTLTKPFFVGVFEMTQKQYELVVGTGSCPANYKGDKRPVENIAWNTIRGDASTYDWPSSTNVDPNSVVGRLQTRTGLNFDLPLEAQWEYACRAGTTSDYNNGGSTENDLKMCGRYEGNRSDGKGGYPEHTTVGSYIPNTWGLYDMHGNVWELCLDWDGGLASGVTDPVGPLSGTNRVRRGGSWHHSANLSISSARWGVDPSSTVRYYGFRLARTLSD